MAWNQPGRAQLGDQNWDADELQAVSLGRDLSAEHRGEPVERETIGERGERKRIDTTAGDEGIDESSIPDGERPPERRKAGGADERTAPSSAGGGGASPAKTERSREADKGGHRMAGNQPGTIEQAGARVRSGGNPGAKEEADEDVFGGKGGQKGGTRRGPQEGTGYTSDRRGQLQHDDSLTGTQGRHGRGGSRHGASGEPRTGTTRKERVGGQTAQNPRVPRDKED